MTIAERGRGDAGLSTAEMFSWSELPELLAAEDLFDGGEPLGDGRTRDLVVRSEDDDDFDDDDDEDDEWDDDEDEDEDDDEDDDD